MLHTRDRCCNESNTTPTLLHRPPSLRLHRPSVLLSTPASHTNKQIDDTKQKLVEPVPAIARRCGPPSLGEFPCPAWMLAGPDGPPPPRFVPRRVFPQPVPSSRASPRPNMPRRPLSASAASASVFSTSFCHHAAASKIIGPTWLDIHLIQLDANILPDCPLTYANESSRNWETVVSAHRVGRPRQPPRHSCCLAVQRQPPRPRWRPTRPTSLAYTTGSGKKSERVLSVSFLRGPTSSTTSRLPSNSSVHPGGGCMFTALTTSKGTPKERCSSTSR